MGRGEKIDGLIRSALSELISRELKDPRVRLATVTSVHASRDLQHAQVLVSVLGGDDTERQRVVDALDHARGFLRRQLASRLRLRSVPELHFALDRGAEHSQRIHELLENLHDDEPST